MTQASVFSTPCPREMARTITIRSTSATSELTHHMRAPRASGVRQAGRQPDLARLRRLAPSRPRSSSTARITSTVPRPLISPQVFIEKA